MTWQKPSACDRCGQPLVAWIMSMFNGDVLCPACKGDEREAPGYASAVQAEIAQVQHGNRNFGGVGLSAADHAFLAERRQVRITP